MVFSHYLKTTLILILISISLFAESYSKEDWIIYNGCKEKIHNNVDNNFDKRVCELMLEDKNNLKKYGAEKVYNLYIEKLYYFKKDD